MKAFTLLLLGLALGFSPAHADTRQGQLNIQFDLNRASPGAMQKHVLGTKIIQGSVRHLRAVYDFTVLGGAIGTVTLRDATFPGLAAKLPSGAIVRDCIIDVITPGTTSASGTMALGTGQSTTDLKAALAAASYTGLVACVPVGTAATAIKLTADRTLVGTIATGALTAGKWYVHIWYEMSDGT